MRSRVFVLSALAILVVSLIVIAQTTHPSTAPAEPKISDAARPILNSLREAYAGLKSMDLSGTMTVILDNGQMEKETGDFTASYEAPGKFRHEMKDAVLVVSDGQKASVYWADRKQFVVLDSPKQKLELENLAAPLAASLEKEDPSLLLALLKDASVGLTGGALMVDRAPDVEIDGTSYQALQFTSGDQDIRALVDPRTGLLRQISADLKKHLMASGMANVKPATVTIDYPRVVANQAVQQTSFAWVPPSDAIEVKLPAPDAPAPSADPSMALMGKAAPAFTLKGTDDKPVSLADFKGQVVVLDFWATWCGPCVESLPHLDEVYKELSPKGLHVFAMNLQEPKERVQKFLGEIKLSLPVLLDSDGAVGKLYLAQAIPQTVIVGKDGVVQKVIIGGGPKSEEELRAAVDAAMKQ